MGSSRLHILDSGLGLLRDLLQTIITYLCWTERSWINCNQLPFPCQQQYLMCWLLKPCLAGWSLSNASYRHMMKYGTRTAGRKIIPNLIQNAACNFLLSCVCFLYYLIRIRRWARLGWGRSFLDTRSRCGCAFLGGFWMLGSSHSVMISTSSPPLYN